MADGEPPVGPEAEPLAEEPVQPPSQPPPEQAGDQPPAPQQAPALPREAYVVLGGFGLVSMRSEALTTKATTAHDRGLGWALSVLSEAQFDPDELIRRRREIAPNSFLWPSCRVSTVGDLRDAGYDVVPQGSRGHAQIIFPGEPTEDDWVTLRAAFGPARPCPPEEGE